MALFKSITEFDVFAINKEVESNCKAIVFGNSGTRVFDTDGNPLGFIVVINSAWELLPGENIAFNQATGDVDTTIYKVAFRMIAGTPGTAIQKCQVARINSITNDCLKNLQ